MHYLFVLIISLSSCFARPQQQSQNYPQHQPTPVSIVSQTEIVGTDGSFNYSYDASNGIHVEQGGYVKKTAEARNIDPNNPESTGDVQVIQGAFSYTAPDGQQISLRYVADDNGFQPEGDHLPKAPAGYSQAQAQQPAQQGAYQRQGQGVYQQQQQQSGSVYQQQPQQPVYQQQ